MIKFFVGLILIWATSAGAANVVAVEKSISLVQGQSFTVPKPAIGAYALRGEHLVEITQSGDKVTFQPKFAGKIIIQVLHSDGSITNYLLETVKDPQTAYFSKNSLYRGYNFVWSNDYLSFSSKNAVRSNQNSTYRGRALLTTRLGTTGKFFGSIDYREDFPTYYYLRLDYKKAYIGYGDLGLQLNPFKPSFINQPRLRQQTVGWNGEQFDLDLWTGQLSPLPSFSSGAGLFNILNANRSSYISSLEDRFSGGRVKYAINSTNSIYASYWYNHQLKKEVPYLGYSFTNYKLGVSNSFTVGNSTENPVFANRFNYFSGKTKNWGLQKVSATYELAKNGYDTLLFNSALPFERLSTSANFYSGNMFTNIGSPYVNMGYSYLLSGYTTNNTYTGAVGWKNSKVDVNVEGSKGTQQFSYSPLVYDNSRINPGLQIWFSPNKSNFRYRFGAEQEYAQYEFVNGETKRQTTKLSLFARHTSGISFGASVARFSAENSAGVATTGFSIGPRIEYRKNNLQLYAQGSANYVDQALPTALNSDYTLGQERYSGGIKYNYNKTHIFDARYIRANDGINNREYSALSIGYTLKLGHPTKSILSVLDSKKISGTIFEDKNLNGVQDKGEEGIKGLRVSVISDKGDSKSDTTDADGDFKISGLNEEVYSFSTEGTNNYALSSPPGSLNLKIQEGYHFSLAAVRTKNIDLNIQGSAENSLMAIVNCPEKKDVNRIPVFAGKVNTISVPDKNDCEVELEFLNATNISVIPSKVSIKDNKFDFTVNSSRIILGQLFVDKNSNGFYEFGEELTNASVVFDKFTLKTDENGIFTTKVSSKINQVKFLRVNGRNCFLRENTITDFSSGKVIAISCRK